MPVKYPPEVMQLYRVLWRWYAFTGGLLALACVTLMVAAPFHAVQSRVTLATEGALFVAAVIAYSRSMKLLRAFREKAHQWRTTQHSDA